MPTTFGGEPKYVTIPKLKRLG
ncbi:hypothetical protein [Staphylococcus aureus]